MIHRRYRILARCYSLATKPSPLRGGLPKPRPLGVVGDFSYRRNRIKQINYRKQLVEEVALQYCK
jgi:hypothetical protein